MVYSWFIPCKYFNGNSAGCYREGIEHSFYVVTGLPISQASVFYLQLVPLSLRIFLIFSPIVMHCIQQEKSYNILVKNIVLKFHQKQDPLSKLIASRRLHFTANFYWIVRFCPKLLPLSNQREASSFMIYSD